jgi:Flp pilus assembly protein TadD
VRAVDLYVSVTALLFIGLAAAPGATAGSDASRAIEDFRAGRYEQASERLQAALRDDPKSVELHFYLGLTRSRLGRSAEALASFRGAETIDPDFPGLQTSLGIALRQAGKFDEAEFYLRRVTEQGASDGSAHLFLGLVYQDQGRWRESIDEFNACLEVMPTFAAVTWFNIGRSYMALGDEASARAALEMSLAADDEEDEIDDSVRSLLASLSRSKGRSQPWWLKAGIGYEYDDELTVTEVDLVPNSINIKTYYS